MYSEVQSVNSLYIHVQKVYIVCNKFQQSSSLRRTPFTVDVMIVKSNGNEQIQVCNLLFIALNAKNVAWLNWHVAHHLTKKIEISLKKFANLTQKIFRGLATLVWC